MMRRFAMLWLLALPAFGQYDGRVLFNVCRPGYSSATVAHDATGRSTPWIVSTGTTFVSGGKYYFQGGTSNRIQQASATAVGILSSGAYWSVWASFVITNPAAAGSYAVLAEGSSASVNPYISLGVTGSNMEFYCRDFATRVTDVIPTNRVANGWHDTVMVRNGPTINCYLDGSLVGSSNNPNLSPVLTGVNQRCVGLLPRTTFIIPFKGMIENVGGANVALTDSEAIYKCTELRSTRP